MQRSGGVLLHPTSLPGRFGIGDLGPATTAWLDFLAGTKTGIWQILPLGPTGFGDSPYQCFSSFAGNPLLVSPERLLAEGLVSKSALAEYPSLPDDQVDYAGVFAAKFAVLRDAFDRFRGAGKGQLRDRFDRFVADAAPWLDEFCLFMALKHVNGGRSWTTWDEELRRRDPASLAAARKRLQSDMLRHAFHQFIFFEQWRAVRHHAAAVGVTIVGDLPFYVAEDSADVWSRQDLFQLDQNGRPTVVAGVPPDYFAETGQLWGNPIYRWPAHEAESFTWWTDRISAAAGMTDVVRIDHFRAFADYWEIPASAPTAETGRWVDGPNREIFDRVAERNGGLPFVAEDLGDLSAKVDVLRDELDLPGMKILQFAFDSGPTDPFLPDHYPDRCVAYTGTHDNDPVNAWWDEAAGEEREYALEYLQWDGVDPAGRFVSTLWESRALWAITQMQDLLRLGAEARMNTPGTASGNWTWRMAPGAAQDLEVDLRAMNERCDRTRPGVPT
jgi:4-alpha-glucanotransferase